MNTLLCLIVLVFLPHVAVADEPVCMPRDQLEVTLIDWYGEATVPQTVSSTKFTVWL